MSYELPPLDFAGQTDVGLKRKKNEDFFKTLVPPSSVQQSARGAFFMVADGIGGIGGGEVASKSAVEEMIRRYYSEEPEPAEVTKRLEISLEAANVFLREQARKVGLSRIGTAAAGLVLTRKDEAVIFNVGDCRIYRIRDHEIEQLSRDQSVMEMQLQEGLVTEDEARVNRNMNLTVFLGQPIPIKAEMKQISVNQDDIFILCSDGLWSLVERQELLDIVHDKPASAAVTQLIRLARERGAPDNVTVVIIRIGRKPARGQFRRWFPILSLIIVLGAVGLVLLLNNRSSALLATASPTRRITPTSTLSAVPPITDTNVPLVAVLPSSTPTQTPILSPTPSRTVPPTDTLAPTSTSTATAAPTDTFTATLISTSTDTSTPTLTLTSTQTMTPTRAVTPTEMPTLTSTPTPTDTIEPTATLNPTSAALLGTQVVEPTPTATPGNTSVLDVHLKIGQQQGLTLTANTALFRPVFLPAVPTDSIVLAPGTVIHLVGTHFTTTVGDAQEIWWLVSALQPTGKTVYGLLPQKTIEQAQLPFPVAIVTVASANVRRGDSLDYEIIRRLNNGEWAEITGISSRGSGWYQIRLGQNTIGWIAPNLVQVIESAKPIPMVQPPPLPPSPTPTPIVLPSETPMPEATP